MSRIELGGVPDRSRSRAGEMRSGCGGKSLNIRRKSDEAGLTCGTGTLKITWGVLAEFFPEGEDADGFLDTTQGDMERVALLGLVKDAFQAVLEEVQFLQELVVLALLRFVRSNG